MPYSDLAYYVSDVRPSMKVATYIREHGGLRGVGDTVTQWANLTAMYNWVNAHPLPDDEPTDSDRYQSRMLLLAALTAAQNKLQGGDTAGAATAFQDARSRYQSFTAQMRDEETPSALALWLAGLGLDIANPAAKLALGVGLAIAAAVILPAVLRRGR